MSSTRLDAFTALLAGISRVALLGAGAGLVAMTAVVFWQVFGRYVLNDTPVWAEPASLLLMSWFIILGAAVGVREGDHLGFDVGLAFSPPPVARGMRLTTDALVFGFGVGMTWYGAQLAAGQWSAAMPGVGISQGWDYVPIAVGGVLVAVFSLEKFVHHLSAVEVQPGRVDRHGEA